MKERMCDEAVNVINYKAVEAKKKSRERERVKTNKEQKGHSTGKDDLGITEI
jgi:hypothetical protein